ncbi:MAG: glucoamylase [Frankiaceae bacterium]|jgi:hypothetical protein|nr:glucoamylase [Frankiaceae bacterium]
MQATAHVGVDIPAQPTGTLLERLPPAPRHGRAGAIAATAALVVAGSVFFAVQGSSAPSYRPTTIGVAVAAGGHRVPFASLVEVPGYDRATRSIDAAGARSMRDWLAAGRVPGAGTQWAELGAGALLDLRVLTNDGASVAGATAPWSYVWPRDASAAAVAFARTGHLDDARAVLRFLRDVQTERGTFDARYLADGSGGVPDARGVQLDGDGWVLWATAQVVAETPTGQRQGVAEELVPLVTKSVRAIIANLRPDGLPRASADYWEKRESVPTLGTVGPTLAGLEAVQQLAALAALPRATVSTAAAAATLVRARTVATFGATGYGRYEYGGLPDAAVTFLAPPFVGAPLPGVAAAEAAAVTALRRPAGGLAPGAGWKADGVSWTPETALFALSAAAAGDRDHAEHWLGWLQVHRTVAGALPEKVLANGEPGGVAPLGWTSALTVLALTELER